MLQVKYTDENLSRKRKRTSSSDWPTWRSGIRKVRVFVAAITCLLTIQLAAATVQWDWCVCEKFTGTSWVVGYSNDGDPVVYDSGMVIRTTSQGADVKLSADRFGDLATVTWLVAVMGEVVNDAMFSRTGESFLAQREGAIIERGTLTVAKNEPFYLAVKVEGFDWDRLFAEDEYVLTGDRRYGWVGLYVDETGSLKALSSAWDLDGGAICVGGGAVPEPSSGMLLVFGLAGLALRRRRKYER